MSRLRLHNNPTFTQRNISSIFWLQIHSEPKGTVLFFLKQQQKNKNNESDGDNQNAEKL